MYKIKYIIIYEIYKIRYMFRWKADKTYIFIFLLRNIICKKKKKKKKKMEII